MNAYGETPWQGLKAMKTNEYNYKWPDRERVLPIPEGSPFLRALIRSLNRVRGHPADRINDIAFFEGGRAFWEFYSYGRFGSDFTIDPDIIEKWERDFVPLLGFGLYSSPPSAGYGVFWDGEIHRHDDGLYPGKTQGVDLIYEDGIEHTFDRYNPKVFSAARLQSSIEP